MISYQYLIVFSRISGRTWDRDGFFVADSRCRKCQRIVEKKRNCFAIDVQVSIELLERSDFSFDHCDVEASTVGLLM